MAQLPSRVRVAMNVLYLGTSPCDPTVRAMLDTHTIGLMCQPASNLPQEPWLWAADNGCFAGTWNVDRWCEWLTKVAGVAGCLFAVVPDVVADHDATMRRWATHRDLIPSGLPRAFVGQNGASHDLPWDEFDCLFIGGTTEWKQSETAFTLAHEARNRGKWVHVGRVNSQRRFAAWSPYADSCDGTFLAFGPTKNASRLQRWIDHAINQPAFTLAPPGAIT